MNTLNDSLTAFDPDIAALIDGELRRQESGLEMIASENYAPLAVMQAQGSVLTNKYAEGYPGRRYYGGCEFVDGVEQLAIDRVKALFGAEYANVQPHSGATANAATMHALLNPGDTILGLSLAHGGHLTHGMRINFSGKLYHATAYEVSKEDYLVDMDAVAEAARTHRPKMIIAGWSAYPRQLDFARFRAIADEVDAVLMVDMAHFAGLVAAGVHPSPVPHAHVVTSTTHKTLGGPRGGIILCNDPAIAKKINSAVFPGQQGGPLEHVIRQPQRGTLRPSSPDDHLGPANRHPGAGRTRLLPQRLPRRGRPHRGGTDGHQRRPAGSAARPGPAAGRTLSALPGTAPDMTISVFDLFTIGIGPSSSHTVGPMRAANQFVVALRRRGHLDDLEAMRVDLFGSLAATGAGHGTMSAILLGLEGCQPETITTEHKERRLAEIAASGVTRIGGVIPVPLTERDIDLHPDIVLPTHPNGMTFTAAGPHGRVLATETYFSVGGGFIVTEQTGGNSGQHPCSVALPYVSAQELLDICDRLDVSISEAALRNETCCRTENEVRAALLHLRDVMVECEQRSIAREGLLPGGLRVRRRAKVWYDRLNAEDPTRKPEFAEDWVNLVALAVNEENASGGRVVTAPTNGAAGIVPAVLHYAIHYTSAGAGDPDDVTVRFLLTAGAIGSLFKERASISGAEVGCQGEVGSAAAMAAAGLAEILGGTPRQVENAAEIAMEHSLGLTCDPIAGLVQIPCIERNAISAGKAINAARMALRGDGIHRVTLDQVIDTMRATGADMHTKYKETSAGGLAINVAVNIVEC